MIRALAAAVATAAVAVGVATASGSGSPRPISFARDVEPLLGARCAGCHPVAYPYLDLRPGRAYDALVRVAAATDPAYERVLPGRPELSYLLLHPPDPSDARLLTAADRDLLRRWIVQGARR